jgi:hypothetical protein
VPSKETQGLRKLENHKNSRLVKPTNCSTQKSTILSKPSLNNKIHGEKGQRNFPLLGKRSSKANLY